VRISMRGLKGREVNLHLSVYDARRNVRFVPAEIKATWASDAPTDSFLSEAWLGPVPGPHRTFFVRAEVRYTSGVLVAMADSRPFRGLDPNKLMGPG
jgi:hypothetical protein